MIRPSQPSRHHTVAAPIVDFKPWYRHWAPIARHALVDVLDMSRRASGPQEQDELHRLKYAMRLPEEL
jgi:hypothetical protein